ncbi:MAG: hypothetical protein ABI592_14975 [Acidobacteriota bacterium]
MTRRPARSLLVALFTAAAAAALLPAGCGGIRTVSKDGYRATLLFSKGERYELAVRGEMRRVEGAMDGAPLVKIMRPDLRATWQFRPGSKTILEETWSPTDEIVPGYPLDPHFDSSAYAGRFHGEILKIADGVHAGHPCDRYQMDLPSGDRVTIWAARDLERLPVRVEHFHKSGEDEFQPFSEVQLVDVRVGAPEKLFQKPAGYRAVKSYEELRGRK